MFVLLYCCIILASQVIVLVGRSIAVFLFGPPLVYFFAAVTGHTTNKTDRGYVVWLELWDWVVGDDHHVCVAPGVLCALVVPNSPVGVPSLLLLLFNERVQQTKIRRWQSTDWLILIDGWIVRLYIERSTIERSTIERYILVCYSIKQSSGFLMLFSLPLDRICFPVEFFSLWFSFVTEEDVQPVCAHGTCTNICLSLKNIQYGASPGVVYSCYFDAVIVARWHTPESPTGRRSTVVVGLASSTDRYSNNLSRGVPSPDFHYLVFLHQHDTRRSLCIISVRVSFPRRSFPWTGLCFFYTWPFFLFFFCIFSALEWRSVSCFRKTKQTMK